MQLEVRFTVKGTQNEIPFTIVQGKSVEDLYLFSKIHAKDYRFPLKNNDGLLTLSIKNPFEESDNIVAERLIGLSTDWIEIISQGFESSSDFNEELRPGYGPDDIFVENKPFSLKQIVDLIEYGDIELTPDFQRNFIWDRTRQSKLIESILLGLPLPSIYLSQYEDGRLTVVDGLQRLSTIRAFMKDDLILTNLEYLYECNNKSFSQLESVLSPLRIRRFGQTQIMCFVIDYRSPSQLKFDLFRRLNTGGRPLNNQEIRNCLSRPHVQDQLREMVNLPSFKMATSNSVKDTRMDAREAALRFIYFFEEYSDENPVGNYNGDIETTLDNFIDTLNKRNPQELAIYISYYDTALKNSYHLFGEYNFRKMIPDNLFVRRSPINKLLMLTYTLLLSKYENNIISTNFQHMALVEPAAYFIQSESNLFEAITWGTNGKWNIETSFRLYKSFFDQYLKGIDAN